MTPKFIIGQKVKPISETEADSGEVLGYSFDGSVFTYKIKAVEVDMVAKKLVEGIRHYAESELEAVQEVEND